MLLRAKGWERMNILIMGMGYVGVTTALVLADLGNRVSGYDPIEEKLRSLQNGVLPFHEPGLPERLTTHLRSGNIDFTSDERKAIEGNQMIFICVGTPSGADGSVNLGYLKQAAESIGESMKEYTVVVIKSTVPVGTLEKVKQWIKVAQRTPCPFDVASNPEFLREGSALHDASFPDRIVIGSESDRATEALRQLYQSVSCPIVATDPRTAEMIKYASNAFLATKISYMNELARLCDRVGIDVEDVALGMGLDHRIGPHFLKAGIGYGGSCFPKDIQALLYFSRENGTELTILESVDEVNGTQSQYALDRWEPLLGTFQGATVAVLGLAFKKDTDDLREAPSLKVISALLARGATIRAHDPAAKLPASMLSEQVRQLDRMEDALEQADAAIICADWDQYKAADWGALKPFMRRPIVLDGKNLLNGQDLTQLGFSYMGIGTQGAEKP
jgi:UDPglucose 6-dehydrogenase